MTETTKPEENSWDTKRTLPGKSIQISSNVDVSSSISTLSQISSFANPFLSHYMQSCLENQANPSSSGVTGRSAFETEEKPSFLEKVFSPFKKYAENFVSHAHSQEDALGEKIECSSPLHQKHNPTASNPSGASNTNQGNNKHMLNHPNGSRLATIQRAYDVFVKMDKDHDHCLKKEDFVEALKIFSPNRSFTDDEIQDIFTTADTTDFGRIHFSEFYAVFACLSLLENKFNNREYNYITPLEVKSAMKEAGLVVSGEQLDHMFSMVSEKATANDVIKFSDVLNIYMSAPRMENDLFLHSWNRMARSDFLHHKQHTDISPAQDLLAGTCAGVALTLVGHPFDTVKVRMQTSHQFKSATECLIQTVRKEGPLAVYKGMSGPMATIPLINSLVFLAYGLGKSFFESRQAASNNGEPVKLSMLEITAAGAFSGFVNSLIVSPVELIKTRLQIQYSNKGSQAFRGPVDCISHIMKASGIKGIFRGMSSTIYREVPGYAGQFFVYELLKRMFMNMGPTPREEFELSAWELLFSGGVAGMGGWVFSYPMDYIKSQIQAEPWNRPTKFKKNPYLFDGGFFSAYKQIVKTKGYKELWRGFGVCLFRAWPANAAGFLAYETALAYMRANGLATIGSN